MPKNKQETLNVRSTTTRKAKIIGTQDYINRQTGEIITCQVAEIEERDSNFTKFWLGNILAAVEEVSNAKMQLIWYLLKNMDYYNNTLLKTVQEIVDESGLGKNTVVETLKILEKYDIIRRKTGVILLNPDIMFKGGVGKRRAVLLRYMDVPYRVNEEDSKSEISENFTEIQSTFNSQQPSPFTEQTISAS